MPNPFAATGISGGSDIRFIVQSPTVRAGFAPDSVLLQLSARPLRIGFQGGNPAAELVGAEPLDGRANFLMGSRPDQWKTGLETFASVEYRGLYRGIDAVYRGSGQHLKSEFLVAPGADPNQIAMEYLEADAVWIDAGGNLVVRLGGTELREDAPVIYQQTAAGRRTVRGRYVLRDRHTVGFRVEAYDRRLPLVIDPTITYSTYLGGTGMGAVTGVARDAAGNLYAGGWTEATNFPIQGAAQAANGGGVDAFLVKLNPTGSGLLYATYIGGTGDDRVAGVAVDSSGQLIAAGATGSSNFPLMAAVRSTLVGGKEAFVLKLNAVGSVLVYSTLLGGSNYDVATAVAVDAAGNAYVGGDTFSADFVTSNATQATFGGKSDAFLAKLNSAGALLFSTFLGGSEDEHLGGVAADSTGTMYAAGGTFSNNFPTAAPLQGTSGGLQDAFVAKVKTTATTQLLFSTYLGGNTGSGAAPEQANAIAVDATGNMYVTGVTSSPNFPVSAGAVQTTASGSRDVFVTKFNPSGSVRLYSSYLGWAGYDWSTGIAVDDAQNAYVTGFTSSVSFANIGGVQATFHGLYDPFVTKLNATGNALLFSTLLGGAGSDSSNAIAVDGSGNIYIGGQTSSLDFPLAGPLQVSNLGGSIGWVARLGSPVTPPQLPSADSATLLVGPTGTVTVTARFSHPAGANFLTTVAVLFSNSTSVDFACYLTYDRAGNTLGLSQNLVANGFTSLTPGSGTAQNDQCALLGAASSVSISGNQLTLTLAVNLSAGFPSNNTVYLYAASASANTGWVARGAFPQPSADSVSPASGTGAAQVFTFVFSDSQNAANVTGMAILINASFTFTNGCYIVYDQITARISLLYDSGLGSTPKPLGSNATVQNSQCAIGAASLTVSGNSNILTVPISFAGPFTGPKNVYLYGAEPLRNTGWVQLGTYTVMAGGVPVASSVSPASGSGFPGTFSFTMSDQGGSGFITGGAVLFSTSLNADNSCYVIYERALNRVSLAYDSLLGSSPVAMGSSASVANSQCQLFGTGATVTTTATTLTLTVSIQFLPAFAGSKNVYLYASETTYASGWTQVGTWTVPGTPPTLISLTPSAGSSRTPIFVMKASDAASASNVQEMHLLVTAATLNNACHIVYNHISHTVGLYQNDGTTLLTKPLGGSNTMQNSQCAIGYSSLDTVGKTLTFTVNVVFSASYQGSKNAFLKAVGTGGATGYNQFGTWTVP